MELKGKVIAILEMKTGEGKKGTWQKQDFVIEHIDGKFTKSAVFTAFGDLVDSIPAVGDTVDVKFNIDAREYNGKWYPVLNAWKIETSDMPF